MAKNTLFGEYLTANKISHADAARELEMTRAYVQMLSTGTATPSLHVAWNIEKFTKGAVTMQTWLKEQR